VRDSGSRDGDSDRVAFRLKAGFRNLVIHFRFVAHFGELIRTRHTPFWCVRVRKFFEVDAGEIGTDSVELSLLVVAAAELSPFATAPVELSLSLSDVVGGLRGVFGPVNNVTKIPFLETCLKTLSHITSTSFITSSTFSFFSLEVKSK